MENNKGVWIIVSLAIANFLIVAGISMFNAVFSTAVGVFFSMAWFFIMSKVIEEKYLENNQEVKLSLKQHFALLAPAFFYFLTVWVTILGVYIF